MATQKKIETVTRLEEKVSKAKSLILADFRGLKHKQLEELRRAVKKEQGEFIVVKNRLILRALGNHGESLKEYLRDSTAVLFAYADEVAPIKALKAFLKTSGAGASRGGLLGDTVLQAADVNRLADLPPKTDLLGHLVGQLNAPVQGLHYALSYNLNKLVWALNGVKEKKQ
jgi:large subunit ribosomal protein L10